MAGQFSLKSFLRQAPNVLRRRYLKERGLGKGVGWSQLTERSVDRLTRAIEEAGEDVKTQIGCDFQQIHGMANEGGIQTLIKEGSNPNHNVNLAEPFGEMKNHYERAFRAFLEHPKIFQVAQQLYSADRRGSWRKQRDLPSTEPSTEAGTRERLGKAISEYYRHKEGRGEGSQVDHYYHEGRLYWFAYPEDYAIGQLVYGDNDELCLATLRPAFEVIFVHDAEERSLSTWVRGPASTVKDLRKLFGNIVLGVDLDLP